MMQTDKENVDNILEKDEDIFTTIRICSYEQKLIPSFRKKCKNNHVINNTDDFDFCPKCGEEVKKYNEQRKEKWSKERKEIKEENKKIFSRFKKDAIAYCELTGYSKAELAFDMAWDRQHSSGLQYVVTELEELSQLMI